jgi:hypothetical protein
MEDILTLAEIEKRFESEWVLLEDPQTDSNLNVQGGTVRWHSKDRDEVYRKALEFRPRRSAILYTGKIPQNTEIAL